MDTMSLMVSTTSSPSPNQLRVMEAPVNLVDLQVLQELPWKPLELTLKLQMPLSMLVQPLLMLLKRSPILPLVTPILLPLIPPQLMTLLPHQLTVPHEHWNKDEKAFNEEKQFEFLLGYIYYKLLGIKFCCFKY